MFPDKKKNKNKNGFTLVETLLIVLFMGSAFLGVYMMHKKASEDVVINKEQEYILTLFEQIEKSASAQSKFENISLDYLKNNGYEMKSTGFNLASITSPSYTKIQASYTGLSNKECSMFVSSIVNLAQNYSAKVNNIDIPTKADPSFITMECSNNFPSFITMECSNNLNDVTIIRENNVFGVVLNTNLDGINNPIIDTTINPCPTGVCTTITPIVTTPVNPITVTVSKPTITVTAPAVVTSPVFTPGVPMTQPVTVPPILTPPVIPPTTPPITPPTIPPITPPTIPPITPPTIPPTTPPTIPPIIPPTTPPIPPTPGTVGVGANNPIITSSGSYPGSTGTLSYDFFAPVDYMQKDYPVMIMIHGGGWMGGSNADNLELNQHMAARGYKVFAPTYTLTQQLPNQMNDISAFSNWLKTEKANFSILNAPISIGGGSAGAHLALFESTKNNFAFKCVYDIAGPVDLTKMRADLSTVNYIGYPDQQTGMAELVNNILNTVAPTPSQQLQASIRGPIYAQRVFALHNENDMLVPFIQTQRLAISYMSQVTVIRLPFNSSTFDGGHNLGGPGARFLSPAFDSYLADYCK